MGAEGETKEVACSCTGRGAVRTLIWICVNHFHYSRTYSGGPNSVRICGRIAYVGMVKLRNEEESTGMSTVPLVYFPPRLMLHSIVLKLNQV